MKSSPGNLEIRTTLVSSGRSPRSPSNSAGAFRKPPESCRAGGDAENAAARGLVVCASWLCKTGGWPAPGEAKSGRSRSSSAGPWSTFPFEMTTIALSCAAIEACAVVLREGPGVPSMRHRLFGCVDLIFTARSAQGIAHLARMYNRRNRLQGPEPESDHSSVRRLRFVALAKVPTKGVAEEDRAWPAPLAWR